jgi:hypothetical protein
MAEALQEHLAAHAGLHLSAHTAGPTATGTTSSTAQAAALPSLAMAPRASVVVAEVGLHDYQVEFLFEHGPSPSEAIRQLLKHAAENSLLWEEIFRTVHCTAEGQCTQIENAFSKSLKQIEIELPSSQWSFLVRLLALFLSEF